VTEIPIIVARSMMMKSNADSMYLPIVARRIQSSEGADFLIVNTGTPIFFTLNHLSEGTYSHLF
jgi:hypothetical protein